MKRLKCLSSTLKKVSRGSAAVTLFFLFILLVVVVIIITVRIPPWRTRAVEDEPLRTGTAANRGKFISNTVDELPEILQKESRTSADAENPKSEMQTPQQSDCGRGGGSLECLFGPERRREDDNREKSGLPAAVPARASSPHLSSPLSLPFSLSLLRRMLCCRQCTTQPLHLGANCVCGDRSVASVRRYLLTYWVLGANVSSVWETFCFWCHRGH